MQDIPAGGVDWVLALPTIVANLHDYFVATAAKLEKAHTEVKRLPWVPWKVTLLHTLVLLAQAVHDICELHHASVQPQEPRQSEAVLGPYTYAYLCNLPQVQKAKSAYLAQLRARGITVDPFERAHRQEQQLLAVQQQRAAATAAAGFASGQASVPALQAAAAPGALALPAPAAASPQAGEM